MHAAEPGAPKGGGGGMLSSGVKSCGGRTGVALAAACEGACAACKQSGACGRALLPLALASASK
eukprot:3757991-Prymnesium_polylepis.1